MISVVQYQIYIEGNWHS